MLTALLELICVDPARIHEFWPHARALIKSAIEYTGLSDFQDLEDGVLNGDHLLWLAWDGKSIDAAATTQLIANDCRPVCVLTACAGHNMDRWLPLFAQIEKYATDEGCSTMRIYGRKGWERVLSGYRVEHVILEKYLGRN